MVKVAQLGIAVSALGIVIALVGLFPGIVAIPPTPGVGVIQILVIVFGFSTMILGALIYAKFKFYAYQQHTLTQQIGIRIAFTGITFAVLSGLADVLGFGSNLRVDGGDILLGPIQMSGLIFSFFFAAAGVVIYALAGEPELTEDD